MIAFKNLILWAHFAVLWIFENVDREDVDRWEGVGSGEVDRGFVDGEDVDKVAVDSVQGKFAG